ncbi:MAG: preprotein translocase subunit SecE [Lachnospiraceae bacterium]|nr:preprotein translocase subunit SecE [Lachnospiraceae bacterium]MDD7023285.1 preprotein translocase subunit SecE [Oscillospiraceae bacterium]MDY5540498.1 preprotein translocase subunit SecE [Lachnospiraceae bacterium]MDY5648946.1 preprotein translocase subunit SecE [Lachnospiraceae bacterium]
MGDSAKTEKAPKKSWFKGLKAEFKKVIWPDRKTLATETTAVVAVSIAVGIIIAVLDLVIQYGLNFLIG